MWKIVSGPYGAAAGAEGEVERVRDRDGGAVYRSLDDVPDGAPAA